MGDDNFAMGYALGQDSSGGSRGGLMGENGILDLAALALLFGWGNGGFGGFGGGGGQALTRAELYDGFAIQNIDSAVRNVQNGISDATYAITGRLADGFHGVDSALCNLGYNMQSGMHSLSAQLAQCCCDNRAAIADVKYQMATDTCALGNTIQNTTRDVIDNQNANYRGLMDFLVGEKLASKDARIAELTNQLSQLNQNAVIGARIDAAVAELLRRTGNDCPTAAYLVQPPTPVNFPTNGCGTVQFGQGGCGCY